MGKKESNDSVTLASLRSASGLTQEAVGKILGVTKNAVYLWESKQKVPAADKFCRLAELYGVDLATLARAAGYIKGGENDSN
jgi:transcriptional regulator with XRE-family HTH domain